MNDKIDELLSALNDGELSESERKRTTDIIDNDPTARARLDSFESVDDLLRGAYRDVLEQPLPRIDADAIINNRPLTQQFVSLPMAAAAGLVLLLTGTLAGLLVDRTVPGAMPVPVAVQQASPFSPLAPAQFADRLNNTLESATSGTPVAFHTGGAADTNSSITITRTWRMDDGRFCREYDLRPTDPAQSREIGVACRAGKGDWRVRMRMYPEADPRSI